MTPAPNPDFQRLVIQLAYACTGLLSLTFSLLLCIAIIYQLWKDRRVLSLVTHFSQVLLLCLGLSDTVTGLMYSLAVVHEPGGTTPQRWCLVEAAVLQSSQLSSVMWVSCICFCLYTIYSMKRCELRDHFDVTLQLRCQLAAFIAISWGMPLTLGFGLYFAPGVYGDAGYWCWIPRNNQALRILCFYLPLVISFTFNVVLFAISFNRRNLFFLQKVVTDFFLYFPAFLVVWLVPLIDVSFQSLGGRPFFHMELVMALTLPLQGFINFMIWGVAQYLRQRIGEGQLEEIEGDIVETDEDESSSDDGAASFDRFRTPQRLVYEPATEQDPLLRPRFGMALFGKDLYLSVEKKKRFR